MTRKKQTGPKFTGALATPIILPRMPLIFKEGSDEFNNFLSQSGKDAERKRIEKLALLAKHYGLKGDEFVDLFSPSNLFVLVIRLALDFVPGFKSIMDGEPTGKKGRPVSNRFLSNRRALPAFFELVKIRSGAKTDQQVGEWIAEIIEGRKGEGKKKRGETLAKRASEGRRLINAH